MFKWLQNYFGFSKKELNGILVLCLLMILVAAYPFFFSAIKSDEVMDKAEFKKEVDRFYASQKKFPAYSYKELQNEIEDKELVAEYFVFDPNGLSEADWKKLGMTDRQIRVIKNFESKGGRFYKKEDLKKIYSISNQKYLALEPYIFIKTSGSGSRFPQKYSPDGENKRFPKVSVIVEINSADSSQLDQLKGIGPAFASRIIKYRNRLGGFHSKEQLMEVYGLDTAKFDLLKDQIRVDPSAILKTNMNEAGFQELKRFPYLSYKQINAIVQYRKQHGSYNSVDDLRKIKILNEEILSKIAPYLSF